jgi:hypothetical protein
MTETTLRRPGRPRRPEVTQEQATPAQETAPVVEQATPDQEQAQQPVSIQYTIAKLTPHMLAGEIHRLHEEGEDLTPIHQVSDQLRGKTEQAQPHEDLKAAVETAKSSPDRPRTFAVAYRGLRGAVKVVHGTECADGSVRVDGGHGVISGHEDSMKDLKETIGDREHYIGYTDEP